MHRLLQGIRERRGMYFGPSDHPFTSLRGFVAGFESGYLEAKPGSSRSGDPSWSLLPPDFHRFVTEHYGRKFPAGGMGWQSFILEHTTSEEEAFALFFELVAEYDRQHPST